MSRPPGTGTFDDRDVAVAIATLRRRDRLGDRWPSRWAVATELCITEEGLRKGHRRRGMTWEDYRGFCTRTVPLERAPAA